MKQKKGIGTLLLCVLLCAAMLPLQARAADPTLVSITAIYTGGTIEVGGAIPKEDISVTANYSDGTVVEVTEFAMSTERVLTDGQNRVMIIYRGKTAEIYVYGKKPSSIYAVYNGFGSLISVGNKISTEDLTVYLTYTDGSVEEILDYRVVNPVLSTVGTQKIQIVYNNLQTTVEVWAQQAKPVSTLTAVYEGEGAPVGYAVPERNLYVTAVYTDGTSERIYNYRLAPETVQNLGENKMIVSYGGKTAEFTVKGVELTAESIEAVYKGTSVEVGDYVAAEDVTVTATYSDGSKAVVTDFKFSSDRIMTTGENTIIINYGGQSATIRVTGIARSGASFSNAAKFTLTNGTTSTEAQIALPKRVETSAITGKSLKPEVVAGVLNKIDAEVLDYIAFDIVLTDEMQDDIFPLTMRITVPASFKADEAQGIAPYLYYTSNRKSVIARVSLDDEADGMIEVTLFRAGTYILVREKEIVEEDLPNPEDDYL